MSPYQSMSCLEDYYKVYIVNKLMSRHGFFNAVIVTSLYKGDSSWPLIKMISTHHVQARSIIFWKGGGGQTGPKNLEKQKKKTGLPWEKVGCYMPDCQKHQFSGTQLVFIERSLGLIERPVKIYRQNNKLVFTDSVNKYI